MRYEKYILVILYVNKDLIESTKRFSLIHDSSSNNVEERNKNVSNRNTVTL